MVLMAGAALDGSKRCDLREVAERDFTAYLNAGFARAEDFIYHDWVNDAGWRWSEYGTRYANARMETPIVGEADGNNAEFTFTGPLTAVTQNGYVVNHLGTLESDTFTFNEAPGEGDEIRGLVGVVPED